MEAADAPRFPAAATRPGGASPSAAPGTWEEEEYEAELQRQRQRRQAPKVEEGFETLIKQVGLGCKGE